MCSRCNADDAIGGSLFLQEWGRAMGNSISVNDYVTALPVALLLALECTSASSIRKSLTFLRQLWKQVSVEQCAGVRSTAGRTKTCA